MAASRHFSSAEWVDITTKLSLETGKYDALVRGHYPVELIFTGASTSSVEGEIADATMIGPVEGKHTDRAAVIEQKADEKIWVRTAYLPRLRGPGEEDFHRREPVLGGPVLVLTPQ